MRLGTIAVVAALTATLSAAQWLKYPTAGVPKTATGQPNLGDYNAGVNHVLPTSGTARFGSPLSVHDFVRRMSVLRVEPEALEQIGADAAMLARVEGLEAHARAIEVRLGRSVVKKS